MKITGKIVVLAYPDTFVKMSDEWICKFLPLVGLGTKEYIKAGHAAQVLIENKTGNAFYYDFGRYITPKGYGRARSVKTDAELEIPFLMKLDSENTITNLEDLLLWLEAHPEKTHGEGRLLASVCNFIDFDKAKNFVDSLQNRGSIPYKAFAKKGSNCARFVTDTILASTSEKKIKKALNFNKKFTPSGIGNVEKAGFGNIFEIFNGEIKPFEGSALKENLKNYFHKKDPSAVGTSPNLGEKNYHVPQNFQKLEGMGSSAYFELIKMEALPQYHFRIKRYNERLEEDFDGVYFSKEFEASKPFQFTYDSHCAFCHVIQEEKKLMLKAITPFQNFKI
ncbi:MAG: DUF6695 family protein [Flavobacteriaceae bacterium]